MKIDLFDKNIGGMDEKLRITGGFFLIGAGITSRNRLIRLAGCIFLFTGVMQKCIFYDLLNINTYNK